MTDHTADFIKALTSPDRRYGEVPFYWWNGESLDKNRLTEQLEMLCEKGVAGVQINYAHLNGGGEDSLPFGGHGKSIPGTPEQFSDEWWEFFSYAAHECERLGMGIGMGDYTIAWIGNGYFTDKVANKDGMNATNLSCEKKMLFTGDEEGFCDDILTVITYSDRECEKPVIIYSKKEGLLNPVKGMCEAYIVKAGITKNSIDPLNPRCGSLLVKYYFEEFERRCPDLKKGTLNYFFQDELMFGTNVKTLWNETLQEAILKKYGYDILGFLPHLFYHLGNITPKIRLDVADARTELMEEYYFKPIFEYHNSRGLIYGCDQSSRGKEPDEFSDYFRTVRWFTAPGNDTPGRAADLIKVKVNSSIAHLYDRPRVWLEGYHSSGWGTTPESITAPTSDNFIFGANLLNLHGLYYSTNGGFFEWAPPDFHFRMPYWDDLKSWLEKYKRLANILTTGKHRADVAVYYPVSSCDYGENHKACVEKTFSTAEYLFTNGVDFDFIDFQSIENARCENGRLITATEEYKAVIFAGVDAIRYSAVKKAKELLQCGGTVIFCGMTPYASDRKGLNDEVLNKDIEEILSEPRAVLCASPKEALNFINQNITRSFLPEELYGDKKVYVHSRVHGDSTLFFVRYAEKDSVCRFEAEGIPYLLDTDTGEIIKLTGTVATEGFSFVKMPLDGNKDTVILFTYDDVDFDKEINTSGFEDDITKEIIPLDGYWDFSLIPTLDNKYGDFYIPAGGIIGAKAAFFDISAVADENTVPEKYELINAPCCTSEAFIRIAYKGDRDLLARYIADSPDILSSDFFTYEGTEISSEKFTLHDRYYYHSYEYSPSLFEQGHHGLKGRIYDDNIIFSENCLFASFVYSEESCSAILNCGDIKPDFILLNGREVNEGEINLNKGKNLIILSFTYDEGLTPNYRNRSYLKRTSVHITKEGVTPCSIPLAASSFANDGYFRFYASNEEKDIFCCRFLSIPGLSKLSANVFGEIIGAYNNGQALAVKPPLKGNFKGNLYTLEITDISPDISEVLLFIKAKKGYEYASIIPEPVKLESVKGRMTCCDLASQGSLLTYSGKALYEKAITLEKLDPYENFFIDIADATATVKIEVNSSVAAVLTYPPFTTDITKYVVHGENKIKITVSNTLCNHYAIIPSKYSNFPRDSKSGLIGPVNIRITKRL